MIPKIIHQIWYQGSNNIPSTYPNYSESWKRLHPDYQYILWDKTKLINLLKNYYPNLYKKFNDFPKMIQKIDMMKYVILYHYGGVYVDMDSECVKPIDDLLKTNVILSYIDTNITEKVFAFGDISKKNLQNGFMAGIKNHPFFKHCLDRLLKINTRKRLFELDRIYVLRTTGPLFLTTAYYSYSYTDDITLLPPKYIDPVSWCDYILYPPETTNYKEKYPEAYTFHHFGARHKTNGWIPDIENKLDIHYCRYRPYLWYIIILIIIVIYFIIKR